MPARKNRPGKSGTTQQVAVVRAASPAQVAARPAAPLTVATPDRVLAYTTTTGRTR